MLENKPVFFDSNILIYAYDRADSRKQQIAAELIQRAWQNETATISFQVLQEFLVNVTGKIKTPLPFSKAIEVCKSFCTLNPIATTENIFLHACELKQKHRLSYWDACIVAQALAARCAVLYSEDMQHELRIQGLSIVNPFLVD